MGKNIAIASAIAYTAIAVFTFGHSASAADRRIEADRATCAESQKKNCPVNLDIPPFNGISAAIIWPLYWSWELQS